MRVLFFPKYTRLGASSRLRTYQYTPYFEEQGLKCEYSPLFDDNYLQQIYHKKAVNKLRVIKAYIYRLLKLFTVMKYDLVIIEKELFPYLPAFAERVLVLFDIKYIVDYDDAIFHNYDLHPNKWVRSLLKSKIANVMEGASLVVAGNNYLSNYAVKAGAKRVVIIPTVIDTKKYFIRWKPESNEEVIIGWIGSPSTMQYLQIVKPILKDLIKQNSIKVHIVGGKTGIGLDGYEEIIEWTEGKEVELIQNFDIGIMPLKHELWELGKCGYKLIQYMGCGLPVIGSPVGANNEIICEQENGFKPTNLEEWRVSLQKLITDRKLREKCGIKGRQLVEKDYSLESAQVKWLSNIKLIVRT
ncbi:glycosyltransferase family 4 protein [Pontibacter litorisediminis]|uniref:glycosyltransferase family 4 protein n=1 Tax=Pontibacter litorisediminis TaxID=1846260 RepID=UPI0023EDB31F|nr:glycosyltransferase family 4 protein [Pontibacter litorisediminis]